jgi:hypothetical protein
VKDFWCFARSGIVRLNVTKPIKPKKRYHGAAQQPAAAVLRDVGGYGAVLHGMSAVIVIKVVKSP